MADEGVYRCWVANVAGQVSRDVTVTVVGESILPHYPAPLPLLPPPSAPPSPTVEPGEVVASVGCQVMFSCLDAGLPPLQFQWTFNDLPLPLPPGEAGLEALVRRNGELLLSDLRVEDSGVYSCTVTGQFENTTSVGVLTVEDPLFPDAGPPSDPSLSSPTPSSQLLSAGQTAQFLCLVGGSPLPRLRWLKNGTLINTSADPGLEILGERVLSVRNVSQEDEGVYTCVASNSKGDVSREFELRVSGEGLDPP